VRPPGRLPLIRRLPPRLARLQAKTVLFDAWRGKYADSPRAISEELHRRDPSFHQVWVLEAHDPATPEWVEAVRPSSRRHLESLGRAKYVVSNAAMPIYWRKKPGQKYLQTWHGTPLKKIAGDIERPQMRDAKRYLRSLARDVTYWDLLLSQNRFSTEVLRRAFRYDGPILEAGYPRNDMLVSSEGDEVRAHTRRILGLEEGVRAVLYAPTWRDSLDFELELDLGALADELGPQTVFLLRAHQHVSRAVGTQAHPRVVDVSRFPDTRDVLLAADVLVTDYSSVMFDFAVTGRPILLYTYDIEHYRDELRGIYLDLEAEAPSPLLRTPAELLGALKDPSATLTPYREAYARFAQRYCSLDDGNAAAKAVELFFSVNTGTRASVTRAVRAGRTRAPLLYR
jgi:CDP-glycerol glycerophosphotransferase